MFAEMISVDPRAEEFRQEVAAVASFRDMQTWGFGSARGAQRSDARELVILIHDFMRSFHIGHESKDSGTTDAHG